MDQNSTSKYTVLNG